MSSYGDYEPEDGWCPTDALADLAANLARRVALLDAMPEPRGPNVRARLAAIRHRLDVIGRRRLADPRDRLRLEQLRADLAHADRRLRDEGEP